MSALPDRVSERLEEGWRPSRIARQYGLRVEVVERHAVLEQRALEAEAVKAKPAKSPTTGARYRRIPAELRAKIRKRHNDYGESEGRIARALGISVYAVRAVVGELGDASDIRRVA